MRHSRPTCCVSMSWAILLILSGRFRAAPLVRPCGLTAHTSSSIRAQPILVRLPEQLKSSRDSCHRRHHARGRYSISYLEQRHLRGQLAGDGHEPHTLSSEEEVQVAAQPLLRLTVVAELPLLRVELAVVRGASHVVYILVMDDRLDEERRNIRAIQDRMDADLARDMV